MTEWIFSAIPGTVVSETTISDNVAFSNPLSLEIDHQIPPVMGTPFISTFICGAATIVMCREESPES